MYEKEVVDQQAVIEKLKAQGEDVYVIRKQVTGRPRSDVPTNQLCMSTYTSVKC